MRVNIPIEVLKILKRAQRGADGWTSARKIASEIGYSVRTVYRSIEELICCGCPIDIKRGCQGGVKLAGEFL